MDTRGVSARPILVKDIKEAVARHFGIPESIMSEPSPTSGTRANRRSDRARPRQIAMAMSFLLTDHTKSRIGDFFGGRDHTTVMHAIRAVNSRTEDRATMRDITLELVRQ
jgi:chromosomal replication initiator protein